LTPSVYLAPHFHLTLPFRLYHGRSNRFDP
jgi:hypothetical protein